MTTKPATPLPWLRAGRDADTRGIFLRSDFRKPAAYHVLVMGAPADQDAAYIVHACNAYPRLVEALRGLWSHFKHDGSDEADALAKSARALLRSFGEEG